jgi:hypothetical protein
MVEWWAKRDRGGNLFLGLMHCLRLALTRRSPDSKRAVLTPNDTHSSALSSAKSRAVVLDAEHAQWLPHHERVCLQARGERVAEAAGLVFVRRKPCFRQGVQCAVVLATALRDVRRRRVGRWDGVNSIDNVAPLSGSRTGGRPSLSSSSSCLPPPGPGWGKVNRFLITGDTFTL